MPLPYLLLRSARKTMALEVTGDAQVLVRAPNNMPQKQIDNFVNTHSVWIARKLSHVRAHLLAHPFPSDELLAQYRQAAKEQLPAQVQLFAEQMQLYPAAVTITTAKTRFGSCSGTNRLCFSCLLMAYPQEAIDYVVVHELAHIAHKNHGASFYALIADILPDWKQRRNLLTKDYAHQRQQHGISQTSVTTSKKEGLP